MKTRTFVASLLVSLTLPGSGLARAQAITEEAPSPPPSAAPAPAAQGVPAASTPATAPASPPAEAPPAPLPPVAEAPRPATPPGPAHIPVYRLEAGIRSSLVPSSGFDPFAADNAFLQTTLRGSRTLLTRGDFSLGVGLQWDVGARKGEARNLDTHLSVHRLAIPVEGRLLLGAHVEVFGRVAAGVARIDARLEDPSSPSPLEGGKWLPAADVSLGGSLFAGGLTRRARLGVSPEVGYGLVAPMDLSLRSTPDEKHPEGPSAAADLGRLSMSGPFFRVTATIAFE